MKKRLLIIALVGWAVAATIVALFAPVRQTRIVDSRDYEIVHQVSMMHLIVTPEKFDGKIVSFIAFLNHEFEGDYLYMRREDYERGIMAHAIYYELAPQLSARAGELKKRYVIVQGRFSSLKGSPEHQIIGPSSILSQISRMDPWPFHRPVEEEPIQQPQQQRP